jgi:hypothetical protein
MTTKPSIAATVFIAAFVFGGCVPAASPSRVQQAPCGPTVPPIADKNLSVMILTNFNYTPKDRSVGVNLVRQRVLDRLNQLGETDGNTFYLQNGERLNFTLTFNLNNTDNNIFSGGLKLSGWGQGTLHDFSSAGQYNDVLKMVVDLTDQAYRFIGEGWHDPRPQCSASSDERPRLPECAIGQLNFGECEQPR